ncbi:HEAT repeat protein [Trichuris suis]|nr:HEAT repeat protein [Trichuris suis]
MDKVARCIESLRRDATPSKKEAVVSSKERAAMFHYIADALTTPLLKKQTDYGKTLSSALSMLFSYFDDTNADVRILTEETINVIIRSSLNDTNIYRIQTDLCKELKRNGSPRSVRAALTKFAAIVETIKPNKRRQFAMTFLPVLMALVKRPEEMIHECIGSCSNRLFKTLGRYFSDDELGSLVRCVLPNLQFPSATARRSAAVLIAELCAHCRKRSDVTSFWLVYIIKELVMLSGKESSTHVLGDLLLLQHLFPIFADTNGESAIDGRIMPAERFDQISDDSWLKLFEATLYYVCSANSVIASAALETLIRIFRNLPTRVLCLWTRRGALKFSSFFQSSNPAADSESTHLDQVSVGSLESSPQEHFELSLDEESQFNPRPLSISFKGEAMSPNAGESGYSESGTALEDMISNEGASVPLPLHSDELLDSVSGDSDECSLSAQHISITRRRSETLPSLSLEPHFDFDSSNFPGQCWLTDKAEEWVQTEFERCLSGESLLQFCARLLSRRFLLAGKEGELVADDQARASHKVLALGALEEIFSMEPSLFVSHLIDGEAQKLSNLSLFCSHNDPQVRGSACLMIGALLESSFRSREVDVLGNSLLDLLFQVLGSMTENESNVTIHCALKAFRRAMPLFMAVQPLKLLDRLAALANLADNAYWLVKVRLAECYADIDFCEVSMLEKERTLTNSTWQSVSSEKLQKVVTNCLLKKLLMDESERVRHAGSLAVVNMVRRGHFIGDEVLLKLMRQYAHCSQRSRTTWLLGNFPKIHSLSTVFSQSHEVVGDLLANDVEFNLSMIVGTILELLKCSPLKDGFPTGIMYALNMLAENFPPVRYPRPWLVVKTENQIVACSVIQHILKMLEVDGLRSEALFNWQISLTFIGRLLAGCIEANMNNGCSADDHDNGILSCPELSAVVYDLIACCSQVMYIYWHVSNRIPVSPVSSPTMKAQSASPMLFSPFRKSLRYASIFRKQTKGDHAHADKLRFDFPRKPPMRRLYEILKGQGATYRVSIDDDSTDRFVGLLRSVTECYSVVLEACSIGYLLPSLEECIFLCRELLRLLPTEIVGLLSQMLKVLFGTNLSFLRKQQQNAVAYCTKPVKMVTFTPMTKMEAFVAAYRSWLVQKMICSVARHDFGEDSLTNHIGWLGTDYHQYINLLFQDSSTKAFLAEVIQLFEPVLVEALHLYNVTCSCDCQAAVVNLISHLILIRVNYSVLDPDNRILDLLCQQLSSHVESNGGLNCTLVCKLFELFLLLSHERSRSSPIIEIPKILRMVEEMGVCKGTSNLDSVAMHVVVIDLFVLRNGCDPVAFNELAIQQEVVISALMKTLQYPETWDTISVILLELRRTDETRWRKVSRDIFDRLLPLLDGLLDVRTQLSVTVLFQLLDLLCPRAFCPIDDVVNTLCIFASKPLTGEYSSSVLLSVVCLARILLLHCPEDVVLDRASNTPSFRSLQIGMSDDKTYKTEHGLARLLLHFASAFCRNLIDRKLETKNLNSNLEESLTNDYLELLVWVTQSGNHPKILGQLSNEMSSQPLVDISSKIASVCAPVAFNILYLTIVLTNDLRLLCDMLKQLAYKTIFVKLLIMLRRDLLVEAIQSGQQELLQSLLAVVDLVDISDEPSVQFLLQEMGRHPVTSTLCLQLIEKEIDARNNNISKQLQLLRMLQHMPATCSMRALRQEISLCASRQYLVRLLAEQAVNRRMDALQSLPVQELKCSDGFDGLANLCDDVEARIRCFNYSSAALKSVRKMIARSEAELELLFDSRLTTSGKNTSFNKLAILQLLREGISTRFIDAHFFAKCIQPLSAIELNEILCDELISGTVLASCLRLAYKSNLSNQQCGPTPCALYASSKEALIVTLRRLLSDSPRSFSVKFYPEGFKIELDCDLALCDRLCSLHDAVQEMIRCSDAADDVLSDREAQLLWNFVEMSMLANLRHLSELNASYIQDSLISLLAIAHKAETRKILVSQSQASVYRLIGCIFWLAASGLRCFQLLQLKPAKVPFPINDSEANACLLYCNALLHCQRSPLSYEISYRSLLTQLTISYFCFLYSMFTYSNDLAFCQLPAVLDMCLAPSSAFKYGWIPEVKLVNGISSFSNVSVRFLRNNDVLKDYIFRIFFLGWSSKQQFEEIWMAMLAVLSATPIGHELCNSDCLDISERVTASSLAVQCICGIFLSSVDFSHEESIVQLEHDLPAWETSCRSFEALFDLDIEANNSIEFGSELSRHLQTYLGRSKACLHFGPLATRSPGIGGKILSERQLISTMDGSSSVRLSMDVQSCLHFLVDLVNHWFKQGPDEIPLPLLTCTVDALVYLLDLLKHDYLDWVCETLESVNQSRSSEDEVMAQTVQFGLLKCLSFKSAASGDDGQKDITNAIDSCIKLGTTDAYKAAHLVIGQLDLLPHWNPNCLRHLFPTLSDLVLQCANTFVAPADVEVDDLDVQICACTLGSLLVCIPVDSVHHVNFLQGFLQLLLKSLLLPLPRPLLTEVFLGLRTIVHLSECEASYRQQLLATTAQWYAKAHSSEASGTGESQFNVMVMERFDMVLRQISRVRTSEANVLAFGCSWFLEEHIRPSDVINKLVHEVLNADPLHEPIFVGLLCQVLSKMSISTDPSTLDWVLLAVPLLLRKQPIARALSCLTCVFLSVTRDPWMTSLYILHIIYVTREVALGRYGRASTFDQDLFVFTARQFYAQLSEEAAAESFRRVLEEVATQCPDKTVSLAIASCFHVR